MGKQDFVCLIELALMDMEFDYRGSRLMMKYQKFLFERDECYYHEYKWNEAGKSRIFAVPEDQKGQKRMHMDFKN